MPTFPFEVSLDEILENPEGYVDAIFSCLESGFLIEAKITEDDGTARDKVTRIQHLGELSLADRSEDNPKYQVIACIGGRGFGVRREDMKKMILATRGKVFTANTLDRLIDCTRLCEFRSR